MQAVSNRTFICSVLFLDVVGYSKKPVADQIQLKERLNALLTEALANVAVNDRIILDTGDGAALNFLGDPEDALFVGLSIREALATPLPNGPGLTLRFGINLGPVKLIKDINGQPNIIGDGINVAQRVMSFAEPGQILVSRSYHEVVSRVSDDFARLFHFEGSRTDKHVREHEVYAVQAGSREVLRLPAAPKSGIRPAAGEAASVLDRLSLTTSVVTDHLRRNPRLGTALAVVAILAVAVGLRAGREPVDVPVAVPAPPPSNVAVAPPAPAPVKEAPKPAAPDTPAASRPKRAAPSAKPVPARKSAEPGAPAVAASAPPAVARAPEATAPAPKAETAPRSPAPAGSGTILFTVAPWGEIYVDGARRGDVPPLYELRVGAGRHKIELRHPDFPSHVRTVDVKPGARIEIKHWFQPAEQPNPFRNLWK
ncbi:MAG: hypothetical protein A3I02_07485 [Betaproteobacteria bacterium RIFCSPLOWO2_02_FULL_67_26]|nr:MAG: hypothetical protein A3I02_07485 [Betaproteobacteria bacterium RIFCSPLOWO2_02_FULL_67_26]